MPLTPAQETYHYNMAKGRVAETLIQELFLSVRILEGVPKVEFVMD